MNPVTLPPGRAMLSASPSSTGSSVAPTIINGTICVILLALTIPEVDPTTMTAGLSATSSVANLESRSEIPSANRYSIAMLWPSTYPRLPNPCRSAAMLRAPPAAEAGDRMPIEGIAACCARAATGHAAAAPPSNVMNSRLSN